MNDLFAKDFRNELSKHNFYTAVYSHDVVWTENHLKAGYNPNKCHGDAGWYDSNPLKVLCEQIVGSYRIEKVNGKNVRKKTVFIGLDIFNLLLKYNVNLNKFPYVWQRVYSINNDDFNMWERHEKDISLSYDIKKKETSQIVIDVITDANVLLEALLKAGADPNMKGHPFPYSHSLKLLFFTDKKAFKYFNSPEATTPLYEAIKKGIKWESQVDLLLEYGATLDETCIEAAKLSGDDKMIEKINSLMQEKRGAK